MSEYSYPFNAELIGGVYDRRYDADDVAAAIGALVGDGIGTETSLAVTAGGGMAVVVSAGTAFIRGRVYRNDAPITLTIGTSAGTQGRYDLVVLRCDYEARAVTVTVKVGSASASPVVPTPQDDAYAVELPLAQIFIGANASTIGTQQITDTRKLARYPIDFDALSEEYKKDLYENLALKYDGNGSKALFDDGTYKSLPNPPKLKELKRFTASGTFTKSSFPSINNIYIFLMVGGGGGKGSFNYTAGNAGNITTLIHTLSAASVKVTVGSGGTSGNNGGATYLGNSSNYITGQGAAGGEAGGGNPNNITGFGSGGSNTGSAGICIVYGFQ